MDDKPKREVIDIIVENLLPFVILVVGMALDLMFLNAALHFISAKSDLLVLIGLILLVVVGYWTISLYRYGKEIIINALN
jgi:hypothetical protein